MNLNPRLSSAVLATVVVGCVAITPASALVEQRFTFIQDGYSDGALVTGSFAGIDLDDNGILVHFPGIAGEAPIETLELTAFAMHFSGNSHSRAFDLSLDDLFGFVFETSTDDIGDDPAFDPTLGQNLTEGIGAIGAQHFYTSGLGPNGFIGGYVGGPLGNIPNPTELANLALDSSPNLVRVTAVPEPATSVLLFALLCAAGRCTATRRSLLMSEAPWTNAPDAPFQK